MRKLIAAATPRWTIRVYNAHAEVHDLNADVDVLRDRLHEYDACPDTDDMRSVLQTRSTRA